MIIIIEDRLLTVIYITETLWLLYRPVALFWIPFCQFFNKYFMDTHHVPRGMLGIWYKVELVTYRLGLVSSLIAAQSLDVETDKWRIIIRGRIAILTGLKLRLGHIEMWNKAVSVS